VGYKIAKIFVINTGIATLHSIPEPEELADKLLLDGRWDAEDVEEPQESD
jgi:hypothetical protein